MAPLLVGLALLAGLAGVLAWLQLTWQEPEAPPPAAVLALPLAAPPAPSPPALPAPLPMQPAPAPDEPAPAAAPVDTPASGGGNAPAGTSEAAAPAPQPQRPTLATPPPLLALAPRPVPPPPAPQEQPAWRRLARPFDAPPERPRIAVVVYRLGMSKVETDAAVQHLPATVTLAFSPYARGLSDWIGTARAAGHEVLVQVPMEPLDYPVNDPGPLALLTSAAPRENEANLERVLAMSDGALGLMNLMGARYSASAAHMRPVLEATKRRGLVYVDVREGSDSVAGRLARELGAPAAHVNRVLDAEASRLAIDLRLGELEQIARAEGAAVGAGYPFPVTIERILRWAATLEAKGLVLAPLSAVVDRQKEP